MAAFSRGCANSLRQTFFQLPPSVRVATWPLRKQRVQPSEPLQFFTRSSRTQLPSKKNPPKPPPKHTKPPPRTSGPSKPTPNTAKQPTTYTPPPVLLHKNLLNTLASRSAPTLLYTAPSHLLLLTLAYGGGTFCSVFAVTYFNKNYLHAPPGLPNWVPVTHGVVSVFMITAAAFCITVPWRIIRRITAIPVTRAGGLDGLNLRLEARRLLPFTKGKAVEVPVGDVSVRGRVAPRQEELLRAMRESNAGNAAVGKENAFLRPFLALGRVVSQASYAFFRECGNLLARSDFTYVVVRGHGVWKLDNRGWMLDQGQAIDRLGRVDTS